MASSHDAVKELATVSSVHDQEQMGGGLINRQHRNNVGVPQGRKHADLCMCGRRE